MNHFFIVFRTMPGQWHGYWGNMGPGMMNGAYAATQSVPANSSTPYYGMGPGMMSGYGMGPGMMSSYGMGPGMMSGYGMGPGMMGTCGMGAGMMSGYGMGHGMTGRYGMGHGMMSGFGMGYGMMGRYGGAYALGLTSEQRDNIAVIRNDSINKAWPIMGQLRSQYFEFARLMNVENPDRAAINKTYARISDLQKQLLDMRLTARQQMMKVLTADQRKLLMQGVHRR